MYFSGLILVTDSNNQCVQCFDPVTGCVRFRFGIRGRGPGQMQRPTGLAVLQNGNLAIADYDNKCVSVFTPCGKFVNRIGVGKLLGKLDDFGLSGFRMSDFLGLTLQVLKESQSIGQVTWSWSTTVPPAFSSFSLMENWFRNLGAEEVNPEN